jgi:hypothetical protein
MGILDPILSFAGGLPPLLVYCLLPILVLFFIAALSDKVTNNLCKLLRALGDVLHRPRPSNGYQRPQPESYDVSRLHQKYEHGYHHKYEPQKQSHQRYRY